MDLYNNNISVLASHRMDWLSERQKIIAENVANADTPGYRAKDLSPFADMLEGSGKLPMTQTSTGHISGGTHSGRYAVIPDKSWGDTISGNNVILEEQVMKSAEIKGNHNMATTIYQKGMQMMSSAIRKD